MDEPQRHSDIGTVQQAGMKNRIMLGDERGSRKRAYVMSNMDIIVDFDKDIINPFQYEAGRAYWAWRDVAGKEQGYGDNPAYGDIPSLECLPTHDSETEAGAIKEQYIILCGLMSQSDLMVVNACCTDSDESNPMIILQVFQMQGLHVITSAFDSLEICMRKARKLFELRVQNALDRTVEKA